MYFVVLKGKQLKLDCIADVTSQLDGQLMFSKDGQIIAADNNNYEIINKMETISTSSYRETTTLRKNVTQLTDTGVYSCTLPGRSVELLVHIISVTTSNADLPVNDWIATPIELQCNIADSRLPSIFTYNVYWEHNGKKIEKNEKYWTNNTFLRIHDPKRSDMGEYQCIFEFFPDSVVERFNVTAQPSLLRAGPQIDQHGSDKTVTKGDNLQLMCRASGFPTPTMTWYKNGQKFKTNSKSLILESQNKTSRLYIQSADNTDEGTYICLATNHVPPFNATAEMRVRVADTSDSMSVCEHTPSLSCLISIIMLHKAFIYI